jgi:hypothetical protein
MPRNTTQTITKATRAYSHGTSLAGMMMLPGGISVRTGDGVAGIVVVTGDEVSGQQAVILISAGSHSASVRIVLIPFEWLFYFESVIGVSSVCGKCSGSLMTTVRRCH